MMVIRRLSALCGAAALLAAAVVPQPTQAAELCISMNGSDGDVAGLQLDLRWDPNCMTADLSSGNAGKCRSDPTTGKNVHTAVNGPNLKALMFSLSDTNPMPDGGLFCCNFTMTKAAGGCCALGMGNVILANPAGGKIQNNPNVALSATLDGSFCAAAGISSSESGPARGPLPRAPLQQPPAVSIPGPGGQAPPPGGGAPVAPGARPPAPAPRAPAAPEAVGERMPGEAVPTEVATAPAVTARPAATGTPRPAVTATAKAPTPKAQGTPTAAPKTTPAAEHTPAGTRKPTAKADASTQ